MAIHPLPKQVPPPHHPQAEMVEPVHETVAPMAAPVMTVGTAVAVAPSHQPVQEMVPFGARFHPSTGQPIPKFDPETGKQNW